MNYVSVLLGLQPRNRLVCCLQPRLLIFAYQHLVFQETGTASGAHRVFLTRPLHVLKLFEQSSTTVVTTAAVIFTAEAVRFSSHCTALLA